MNMKKYKDKINLDYVFYLLIVIAIVIDMISMGFFNFLSSPSSGLGECNNIIDSNNTIGSLHSLGVFFGSILLIIFSVIFVKKKVESKKKHIIRIFLGFISIILMPIIFNLILALVEYPIQNNNVDSEWSECWKPIIYLYPTEEVELNVKLGIPESLIVSYPKYTQSGWNVIAKPNGDLVDTKTNRNLYSLYYENDANYDFKVKEDGFVVKGEEAAEFLEEKLSLLGLDEREAEEFIVFWLPKLQENKYNYIRFATDEEISENMPLSISIKPDTLIRVMMTYKSLDKPIKVKEQKIDTPKRNGFVAVEWGGTQIK